jgi:ASC-1-like (ASCH) protein
MMQKEPLRIALQNMRNFSEFEKFKNEQLITNIKSCDVNFMEKQVQQNVLVQNSDTKISIQLAM